MFDDELGEETRIQPAEILQSVDGGIFSGDSQIECGVSQREVEIDEQCALG